MDGLRFIAIFFVLIEHFPSFIGRYIPAGYFGVDLFFVISGFLITEGLLIDLHKTKKEVIRSFYIKRVLRIFPIYYLFLILSLIFYKPFMEIAPYAFSYTVNYNHAVIEGTPFEHLWSLCVEEQFYLIWPFLIVFIRNKKILLFAMLMLFCLSISYFIYAADYSTLAGRMFSLVAGAIMAFVKVDNVEVYKTFKRYSLYVVAFAILLYAFVDSSIGLTVFSVFLVYTGSNNGFKGVLKKILENPKVLYVGKVSYGLYLYHMAVGKLTQQYIFDPVWQKIDFSFFPQLKYNSWIIKFPLYTLLSIGVAALSYRYIESYFLKLKKKFT